MYQQKPIKQRLKISIARTLSLNQALISGVSQFQLKASKHQTLALRS